MDIKLLEASSAALGTSTVMTLNFKFSRCATLQYPWAAAFLLWSLIYHSNNYLRLVVLCTKQTHEDPDQRPDQQRNRHRSTGDVKTDRCGPPDAAPGT